jgi:hypothetical protein
MRKNAAGFTLQLQILLADCHSVGHWSYLLALFSMVSTIFGCSLFASSIC